MVKLELTWIDSLKQWRKRRTVDGKSKTFYLGTGGGRSDKTSYLKALAKWRDIERDTVAAETAAKTKSAYEAWAKQLGHEVPTAKPPPMSEAQKKAYLELAQSPEELEKADRLGRNQQTYTAKPKAELVGPNIDSYIAEQKSRYEHGQKFPNAPRHERCGLQRFIAYRYNANILKKAWGTKPLPTDEPGISKLMKSFRDDQNKLLLAGEIADSTFNERIKTMRHFVGWLHDNYKIPVLPRKLHELCSKHQIRPKARAIDLKTIRTLWNEASPRLRCYIALALNCGFYQIDIATLCHAHIKAAYIECDRHKTGVPTRFKLWTITKRLLKEQAKGKGQLAFDAEDGGPLFRVIEDGKGRRWSQIENDLLALKKRLRIEAVSFSNFRDTSSTKIEGIARHLTDLFDGHKDGRMAKYYIDGKHVDYGRMYADLDRAIDELEQYYGLK